MGRRGAVEIVEGAYVAHVVFFFHRRGVFETLGTFRSAGQVAREHGFDEEALSVLLEFLCQTTDLLVRNGRSGYKLARRYETYRALGFPLDKFLGAYGGPIARLAESLLPQFEGAELINDLCLTEAFLRSEGTNPSPIAAFLGEIGVVSLLDLGCGTAALLRELCRQDPSFKGWGIDASRTMCAAAAERIASEGLNGRIRLIHGDVRRVGTWLPLPVRREIQALHMRSLLNEFCRSRSRGAVAFLRRLRKLFPDRLLFIFDYYGKLTHAASVAACFRHTMLQDVVQALTRQGVPPPDLAGWSALYRDSGCVLMKAYEGETEGLQWFLHAVRL